MDQVESTNTNIEYRICSPSGVYPDQSCVTNSAGLVVNEQLIAVFWDAAVPNIESQLMSTLLLATDFQKGFLKLYLFPFYHQVAVPIEQISSDYLASEIREKVNSQFKLPSDPLPEFDHYRNAKGASLPLLLDGMPYHKTEQLIDEELFLRLFSLLDDNSFTDLFKVIELLVSSSQLSCHFQFQHQANYYLLLAIECCEQLDWIKTHPLIKEWKQKIAASSSLEVADNMSPIEFIKLYKIVITIIRNSLLEVG